MLQRDGTDCRTTSAEEGTKRTCFFGRGDNAGKKWYQSCPKWLMNEIDECAPQFFVVFRSERRSYCTRVSTILNRCGTQDFGWQELSCYRSSNFKLWNA